MEDWRRTDITVQFIAHSVEEAVFLGADVVVMSARPGRIVEHIRRLFAEQAEDRDSPTIKAHTQSVMAIGRRHPGPGGNDKLLCRVIID